MNKDIIFRKIKSWKFIILLFLCAVFYIFCKIDEAPPIGKMSGTEEPDIGMHEIAPGEVISQSFAWTKDTLAGISLMLAPEEGGIEDPVSVSLFRGDRLLKTWRVNKYGAGNTWTKFLLDKPQRNAQGTYTITVTADKQMELALGLTSEDAGAVSGWMINGAENEGQYLCWRGIERDLSKSAVMIVGTAVLLVLFAGVLLLARRGVGQEWMFLFIYAVLGVYCLAALPESRTPDEFSHFGRSYEISQGNLISEKNVDGGFGIMQAGGTLPGNLEARDALFSGHTTLYDILDSREERLDYENPEFYGYANTALYAPTSYLFQAIGIRAACCFTDRVIAILYAGRIANWAAIGVLLFWSIRRIPVGKTALAFLALLPMNIQQYNSLSADGFAFAMTAVFISFVLSLRTHWQRRISRRQAALLYVVTVLLCLCKIVYAPICLLLFLLPWESFGSRKRYAVHAVGLGAASIISSLGWFLIASSYLIEFQPGVKSGEQILHVLSHPLQYLETLFCTLNNNFSVYLMGAAGQNLGALDIPLGELLPLFCLTVLLMACGYESEKEVLERRSRCLMLAVFGIVVLLTFTSLYIQWTPYQSSTVRGVQGRYFLPAMLLLILGAGRLRRRMSIKNGCLAMAAANACAFSAMLVYIV